MILTFFKASQPYDKTNGYWEGRLWTHGFTGPMSIREAQRLSSMLGGRWFDVDLPEISTISQLLEKLGAELPKEFTDVQLPGVQYVPAEQVPSVEVKSTEEKNLDLIVETTMNATNSENRNKIEALGKEVPAYAEQVKILADAKTKKVFDYTKLIGRKRDVASILKAYTVFVLKDEPILNN